MFTNILTPGGGGDTHVETECMTTKTVLIAIRYSAQEIVSNITFTKMAVNVPEIIF